MMGFMGGMGGMGWHKKMGKPSVTKACPYFIPLCLFYVLSLCGSPVRPLLLFYRIARETDAEFLEDLTVNL